MLQNALTFSHNLLKQHLVPGDQVIDGTVGNGNDTVLLANLVGKTGKVYGFDIQAITIQKAEEKLFLTGLLEQTVLFKDSHDKIEEYLPENASISAAVFNLGYLPSGDKSITTQAASTISAIKQSLDKLRTGGLLLIMVYWGHDGGKKEKDALDDFLPKLSQKEYHVLKYQFINQKNSPPFLYAVEKRG